MRGWLLVPIALVAAVLVALPAAALTETGLEKDLKGALGFDLGECEPATNLASPWTTGPDLPFKIDEPRATTIDGKIYLVGGITGLEQGAGGRLLLEPTDELTRFDPITGSYLELAPLPQPLHHIGAVSHDRDLYVVGGYRRTLDANTSKAFYRYDPDGNRWSRMPDMPEPRAAMAVGVIGNRLIVAGGGRDNVPLSDTFAFNFRTRRWSRLPDMPSRREHVGYAVLGGKLYVLGGRAPGPLAVDTAESYDAGNRRWTRLPPMPVPTGGLGAVTVDGRVIAIGGGDDGAGTVTGAVQEWDPSTGKWALLPEMRTPLHGHAVATAAGKIWVFGGSPCAYFNATDIVEWLRVPQSTVGPR